MSEGYPDYQRLARTGQYQLYFGANITPPENTSLFQGYVGNFPFVNLFTDLASSTDFMQINLLWYPDSTFTTPIAFRRLNRGGSNFAITQYANLSDWLQLFYVTKSGNPMTFTDISMYGTQQPSDNRQLGSYDTALMSTNQTVAASTTVTIPLTKLASGTSLMNLFSGAVAWNANILYYDYGSNSFINYYSMDQNAFADAACHIQIPLLDTPMQFQFHNQDTAPRGFSAIWNPM